MPVYRDDAKALVALRHEARAHLMVVLLCAAFISLGLVNLDFSREWWRDNATGSSSAFRSCWSTSTWRCRRWSSPSDRLTVVDPDAERRVHGADRRPDGDRVPPGRVDQATGGRPVLAALGGRRAVRGALEVSPVVDASGLRDVPEVAYSDSAPPPADMRHLRVVPEESAIFAGEKVIGQLGTYYSVGTYNVQVERGRLVWVAPLDFQGVVQWLRRGTSPGVIVVSAENPDARPNCGSARRCATSPRRAELQPLPARLLPVRHRADSRDDAAAGRPGRSQYLCTLGRPTIGWSGEKVTAVVIVDPATGACSASRAQTSRPCRMGQPRLSGRSRARLQRLVGLVRARLVERAPDQTRHARTRARRGLRAAGDGRPLRVVRRSHVADGYESVDDRLHLHGHRRR